MPSTNAFHEKIDSLKPVEILLRSVKEERFPQSVILSAKNVALLEGVASRLARELLRHAAPTDEAASFPLESHPDLLILRPAKKMRQISADSTRELIRKISHSPQLSRRKVALIHEADRMNKSAANIFLKTLEEPPPDTVVFLLTTYPYALLPTIRSRCLSFRFPESNEDDCPPALHEWLAAYREWLSKASAKIRRPADVAPVAIALYGLLARFQHTLDEETARIWEEEKEKLSSDLDSEQLIAMEVSVKVSVRHRFFLEIEAVTHAFARELGQQTRSFPGAALASAVTQLEKCAGLLNVNLKEQAALEYFLLQSLRIWARR